MHNKTRKRQKIIGGNNLQFEINEILNSLDINSNQTNITKQQVETIIEKIKKNPDLLPLITNNPALKEFLKTSGGTRHKKIRKQKGGVKLALFLAALTYPFLGATHSPGNTPQFKGMRAIAALARGEAAGQQRLRNARQKGEEMISNIRNPHINPHLYVGDNGDNKSPDILNISTIPNSSLYLNKKPSTN